MREVVHTLQFNWSRTVWVITFGFYILAAVVIGVLVHAITMGGVVAGIVSYNKKEAYIESGIVCAS